MLFSYSNQFMNIHFEREMHNKEVFKSLKDEKQFSEFSKPTHIKHFLLNYINR